MICSSGVPAGNLVVAQLGEQGELNWTVYPEGQTGDDGAQAGATVAAFVQGEFPEAVRSEHAGGIEIKNYPAGWAATVESDPEAP